MRYHAIAIILLMIGSILSGCIGDDASTNDDVDDTAENIDGTINETVNQTTNDTAGNETTDGGNGTTNNGTANATLDQYPGYFNFMSFGGFEIDANNNLSIIQSRYGTPLFEPNEERVVDQFNCTNGSVYGFDEPGIWDEPYCKLHLAPLNLSGTNVSYNGTSICWEANQYSFCEYMITSGRVMWYGYEDSGGHCEVFIQSEPFSLSGYEDATTGQFDFNNLEQLVNDTAFIAWEADRVAAYTDESANQPAWCSDPLVAFSQWYASLSAPQPAQYIGFMDNSSIYGWKINPIENLSRIYIAYSEENCTNTDHGDDWNGTSYSNSICVKDLGQEWGSLGYSIIYQNGELCIDDSTENYCWNLTVSNRVMWLQGDIWGGQEEICSVYIQSERFVPSSGYHLALRAYDANGNHIQPGWDSLLNDPDYTIWNDERMDAYNTESSNAPSWCTDPQFGWIIPASQIVG